MSKKIKCALIGPGNIGTDLLAKLQRSPVLEPVWMVGIDPDSDGLKRAREMGIKTTDQGVDGLVPHIRKDGVQIVFDATSAYVHAENSRKVTEQGAMMVDLTPAAIGPYCVPPVNLREHVGKREMNVNMVTCGGQATIPMVAAVSRVQPVAYAEIVATVSSKSAGPGTRKNIDEFTRTTAGAIEKVGGARKGKAIIIINPAEPPLIMRDTVHCLVEGQPDQAAITKSIHDMMAEVQKYVPGYKLVNGPVFDGQRVSVFLEVEGPADYLPTYAGNLDIMTAAAVAVAPTAVIGGSTGGMTASSGGLQADPRMAGDIDALQARGQVIETEVKAPLPEVAAVREEVFQQELNKLREEVQQDAVVETRVAASVFAVSTGLSVGYVLWLLRGGVLIASLLSSIPAWRLVDPLPVLGRVGGPDDEDDESLEEMVENRPDRDAVGADDAPRGIARIAQAFRRSTA